MQAQIITETDELYGRPLSGRELEVLSLVAKGRRNQEIADDLDLSNQTVRHHLHRIGRKLGVHDRTAAVVRGLERGLITLRVV